MLLLLSLAICQTLLMMLLLPLILLVYLVRLLKNRSLLLPDSRELKFLLPKPLSEKLMVILILLALRRDLSSIWKRQMPWDGQRGGQTEVGVAGARGEIGNTA